MSEPELLLSPHEIARRLCSVTVELARDGASATQSREQVPWPCILFDNLPSLVENIKVIFPVAMYPKQNSILQQALFNLRSNCEDQVLNTTPMLYYLSFVGPQGPIRLAADTPPQLDVNLDEWIDKYRNYEELTTVLKDMGYIHGRNIIMADDTRGTFFLIPIEATASAKPPSTTSKTSILPGSLTVEPNELATKPAALDARANKPQAKETSTIAHMESTTDMRTETLTDCADKANAIGSVDTRASSHHSSDATVITVTGSPTDSLPKRSVHKRASTLTKAQGASRQMSLAVSSAAHNPTKTTLRSAAKSAPLSHTAMDKASISTGDVDSQRKTRSTKSPTDAAARRVSSTPVANVDRESVRGVGRAKDAVHGLPAVDEAPKQSKATVAATAMELVGAEPVQSPYQSDDDGTETRMPVSSVNRTKKSVSKSIPVAKNTTEAITTSPVIQPYSRASLPKFQKKGSVGDKIPIFDDVKASLEKMGFYFTDLRFYLPGVAPENAVDGRDCFSSLIAFRQHLCQNGINADNSVLNDDETILLQNWVRYAIVSCKNFEAGPERYLPEYESLSPGETIKLLKKIGLHYNNSDAKYYLPGMTTAGKKVALLGVNCFDTGKDEHGLEHFFSRFGISEQGFDETKLDPLDRLRLELYFTTPPNAEKATL
jgi:hypothetical protein